MSNYIILDFTEPLPNKFIVVQDGKDYYVDNGGLYYLLTPDHLTAVCTEEVEEISTGAYSNLTVLKAIRIPALVKSIGLYAFSNCSCLSSIIFEYGGEISIEDILNSGQFESPGLHYDVQTIYQPPKNGEYLDLLIECEDVLVYSNCETSLYTFTINGYNVLHSSLLKVRYGTTSVTIVAEPVNYNASVQIIGGTNLQPGANPATNLVTVIVTVNKSEGCTETRTYKVLIFVRLVPDELACLLEGTLVQTPNGYVPIETIKEGDCIRTLKYDIPVTKVGKWVVDLNDEAQRRDLSRKMYKIPAGHLNCNSDTYISHYHRILIEDLEHPTNTKLFRLPEKIGLQVANPHEFIVNGKYNIYHLQVKHGNYFIVNGGCIVEAWESGAKFF